MMCIIWRNHEFEFSWKLEGIIYIGSHQIYTNCGVIQIYYEDEPKRMFFSSKLVEGNLNIWFEKIAVKRTTIFIGNQMMEKHFIFLFS